MIEAEPKAFRSGRHSRSGAELTELASNREAIRRAAAQPEPGRREQHCREVAEHLP